MTFEKKYGIAFLVFFLTEIYIGIFVHDNFIRPYIGDVLVVILIYCFIKTFFKIKSKLLPMYIFIFAMATEIGQFFNIVEILGLEDNPILSTAIGSTFDIKDIICYFVGCLIIVLWEYFFRKKIES